MVSSAYAVFMLAFAVLPSYLEGDRGISYCPSKNVVVYGGCYFPDAPDSPYDYKIMCRTLGANDERLVWQSASIIGRMIVSKNGLIAFEQSIVLRSQNCEEMGSGIIRVVDLNGNLVKEMPRGCGFIWSPDGRYLLYLTGCDSDAMGRLACEPDGAWIWDSEKDTEKKINITLGFRYEWAQFDNNIYVEGDKNDRTKRILQCYEFKTGKLKETAYAWVGFSPDGRYSVVPGSVGGFGLYDNLAHRDITYSLDNPFSTLVQEYMTFGYWYDRETLIGSFSFGSGELRKYYYFYNIKTGAIRRSPDYIVGVNVPKKGEIIVMDHTSSTPAFKIVPFDQLEKITLEMLHADIEESHAPSRK